MSDYPINPFTIVHLPGFPCGATHGRYGKGWHIINCEKCLAIQQERKK